MVLKLPAVTDGDVMLLEREVYTLPYAADSRQQTTVRLRPNLIKHFLIHVEAICTAPVGPVTLINDYPWRLIEQLTIYTPRGEVLKSVTGRQLHFLNCFEFGTEEYSTFRGLAGEEEATMHFDLLIPFENPTGIEPEKTVLNLNEFTELYIAIQWGNALTDMYEIGSLTLVAVNCWVNALEREPLSMSDEMEPRQKLVDQSFVYDITGDEMQILLPENTLIKTILFQVTAFEEENYPRVDGMIDRIRIEDDDHAHVIRSWTGGQIQSANKSYYGIETGFQVGNYIIEFDQLRDLTTLYKTFGINYPKAIIDFIPGVISSAKIIGLLIRQVTTPPALTM